jgi:CHAD domain-containing protein
MEWIAPHMRQHAAPRLLSYKGAPDISCETAFRHIAKDCIRQILGGRTLAVEGNADAVHKMRIELTRLHAAVLFFTPLVVDDEWPRIRRELRWLNSNLGKARDQDVLIQYARRRRFRSWAKPSYRSIARSKAKSYRKLAGKLHSARYQRFISDLNAWVTQPRLESSQASEFESAERYSEARLLEWRDEIQHAGRHLGDLGRKRQHRLRIRCKRYRYIVDSLLSLGVGLTLQDLLFLEPAKQVHSALGDLRDLRQLRRTGDDLPPRYRARKRKLLEAAERPFRRR